MKSILVELKKNFHLPFMIISIIGLLLLFMLSEALERDNITYTTIELMFGKNVDYVYENSQGANILIWQKVGSIWFVVFAPLFVSLGSVFTTISERESGNIRLMCNREGSFRYAFSKIVSSGIAGGFIMTASYALYYVVCKFNLPDITWFNISESEWPFLMPKSEGTIVFERLAGAFIYGMFINLFGTIVVQFFKDKYVVVCVPILLSFFLNRGLLNVSLKIIDKQGYEAYNRFLKYIPERLFAVFYEEFHHELLVIMAVVYVILLITCYVLTQKRRVNDEWN